MNSQSKAKKILIKVLKVVGWITFSIILLLVLVALAVQIPAIQNRIVQKAVAFLEDKIGTTVTLDHISLSFPKKIVLTGLYLEDQSRDTLLYAGKLSIDTDLWQLTKNRIELSDIRLENFNAFVSRSKEDSAFNFDYIIDAFADTTTTAPDTTATPWAFALGDVELVQTRLFFKDSLDGNDVEISVGELEINTDKFDLANNIIDVGDVNLSDVSATVVQSPPVIGSIPPVVEPVPVASDSFVFDISFDEINLNAIEAAYTNYGSGQVVHLNLKEAAVEADEIDLKRKIIRLDNFSMENTFVSYQQMSHDSITSESPATDTNTLTATDRQAPWVFALDELTLLGNTFQYHNFTKPALAEGIDFNHLWISAFNTEAQDLRMEGDVMEGQLHRFSFQEKSGFAVTSFSTAFALDGQSATIDDFIFTTPNSRIAFTAHAEFKSLASLANTYPQAAINVNVAPSTITIKDLMYFSPTLLDSLSMAIPKSAKISVEAACKGTVNNLALEHLLIKTLNNTVLNVHGHFKGLPDFKTAFMDVSLDKLYTTDDDIGMILPDSLIPESIATPDWINLKGDLRGTLQVSDIRSTLATSLGVIAVNGKMNLDSMHTGEHYNGVVNIKDFHVGKLLKQQQTMGALNANLALKGRGLKMEDLDAYLKMTIDSFEYNQYTYRNFNIEGSMKEYFFSGKALLEDKNLDFNLGADLDYANDIPHYKLILALKNADFKALKLSTRPIKARGTLDVKLATADFKVLNGNVDIRNFAIYNGEALYSVDSLLFVSIDQKGQSEVTVESDILSGKFSGTINLPSLPQVMREHINTYFTFGEAVKKKDSDQIQDFEFNLVIKNTDLLTEVLLPDLEPFVPGEIAGEFDSRNKKLNLRMNLSEINYAGIAIDSVWFKVLSDKQSLDYTFALKKIVMDTLRISALRLAGNVMNDSIHTNFMIMDSLDQEKYFLGGVFNSFKDVFQFRFLPGQVVLNYEAWKTPMYNSLRFTRQGLEPNNFWIGHEEQRILLLKKENQDSTLSVVFNAVDLKNITSLVEGTTPLGGLINGDLNIGVAEKGAFNSTLRVDELSILEEPWGELRLALGQTSGGPLNADLRVEGDHAEMQVAGYLTRDVEPEIHFKASISRLDLAIVEPLTLNQLKEMKGRLVAEVNVNGKAADPEIEGILTFKEAGFRSTYVNSVFMLKDESIRLKGSDLALDDFSILDEKGNVAKLDGTIRSDSFREFNLDLALTMENFQLLNTTEADNDLFYGNVGISTRAKITGTSSQPQVQMDISLTDESQLTYIVPQSEKGVLEQKGIVRFVDKDAKDDPFMKSINLADTVKSNFNGIDVTANIELSDKETFNIIIDPVTGDKLSVKGNSTLTFEMDPTGDMQLAGRYEISEGTYNLSFYKLVKRTFSIEKGSTIMWSGDPLNATMNIKAVYEVETSPLELMTSQSEAEANYSYKERLPFLVYLIIKGELMTPEISFQLDMPEEKQEGMVYAKIKDLNTRESDLNKQVFALLVLKRFIAENPFDSGGGSDVESTARRSVSKLLTEQLNRLSENVKGVELSVDLKSYEDYSTGSAEGQTELQLGLSKSLFNDRLVVKVSGNVGIEGEATNQNSLTDYIGDLAVEYKLTEDGRFRITGFRNSNYDMIDGELIETGTGFIYIKDYDTLRELLKANAKEN